MAEPIKIDLISDASVFINNFKEAALSASGLEVSLSRLEKDLIQFDDAGNAVARTLVFMDEAANKFQVSLRNGEEGVESFTTVTRAANQTIKQFAASAGAAAESQALLQRAASLNTEALRAEAVSLTTASEAALADAEAHRLVALGLDNTIASSKNFVGQLFAERAQERSSIASNNALVLSLEQSAAARLANSQAIALEAKALALRTQAAAIIVGSEAQEAVAGTQGAARRDVSIAEREAARQRIVDIIAAGVEEQKALAAREVAHQKFNDIQAADLAKLEAARTAAAIREAIQELELLESQSAAELASDERIAVARQRLLFDHALRVAVLQEKQETARLAEIERVAEAQVAADIRESILELQLLEKRQAAEIAADEHIAVERLKLIAAQALKVAAFKNKEEDADLAKIKLIEDAQTAERARESAQALSLLNKRRAAEIAADARIAAERIRLLEKHAARSLALQKKIALEAIAEEKRIEAERVARVNRSRAEALRAVPSGLDTRTIGEGGKASFQQVQALVNAQQATVKLGATSQAVFTEIQVALVNARNGTLLLAQATTQAERAAFALAAAERQVGLGAKKAAAEGKTLGASFKSLGNLIGISLLIGGAFKLTSAISEAARAAGELSIKIAQIETISVQAARSTESWAEELRVLSNRFGIDTLKQAEGAYGIISRQIKNAAGEAIQGAEALRFLEVANKLAVTGVTDTATATNLLSATLNAFKIPAEDAEQTAAKLFKTVELGALVIEDISDILGRVAVPARQLGLSLDEVLGSIDGLTRQGFKADEAITGIRNVILKLIKPTEAGSKALRALGADTGQALIQARGFIPGLTAFINELGNTVEGTAEGFGRIRAIVGVLGLTGENANDAADSIKRIEEASISAFGDKTQRVLDSVGNQFARLRQEADNLFEKELGTPALEAILEIIKDAGGLDKVLEGLISTLKDLSIVFKTAAEAALFTAKNFEVIGSILLATFTRSQILAILATAASIDVFSLASVRAAVAQRSLFSTLTASRLLLIAGGVNVFVAAAAAATVAVAIAINAIKNSAKEAFEAAGETNLALQKANTETAEKFRQAQARNTQVFDNELEKRLQSVLVLNQNLVAAQNAQADALQEQAKETARETGELLKVFTESVSKQLTSVRQGLKDFEKDAKTASEAVQKILSGEGRTQLDLDINTAGFGTRIRILEGEIETARLRVAKATSAGNIKEFEDERKRLNELVEERIDAQIGLSKEQSQIDKELQNASLARIRATTSAERQAADDRIANLRRQERILREGNAAQLQQERALQDLREEARTAQDAASFKTALDALSALRREQERLNVLAATERQIRAQTALESAKQAQQAAEIARINEERADFARQEEQRIKALQLVFNLVQKEAEAFSIARITEGETAADINKALAEQQNRLAQLTTLSRELTGTQQLDPVFLRRETDLREQAQAQINKIELQARADRLVALKDELKSRLAVADTVKENEIQSLLQVRNRLGAVLQLQEGIFSGLTKSEIGRRLQTATGSRATGFNAVTEDANRLSKSFELVILPFVKKLDKLISQQVEGFTDERQSEIRALIQGIGSELNRPGLEEARQRISALNTTGGAGAEFGRDVEDINNVLLRLLIELPRASSALEVFGNAQEERSVILDLLTNQEQLEFQTRTDVLRNSTREDVKALEGHSEALSISERAIRDGLSLSELAFLEANREIAPELSELEELVRDFNDIAIAGFRVLEDEQLARGPQAPLPLQDIIGDAAIPISPAIQNAIADGYAAGLKDSEGLVAEQFRSEASSGISDGVAELERKASTASEARQEANARQDSGLQRQIDQLEAEILERQAVAVNRIPEPFRQAPVAPVLPEIDRSIFLGAGAPSIQLQQDRIAALEEKNLQAQEEFQQVLSDFTREERERRQADAAASGRVGVNAQGQLVSRASPIQQKQLSAQEETARNTASIIEAIRATIPVGEEPTAAQAEAIDRAQLGLGSQPFTAFGPGDDTGAGLAILRRGQAEAEAELDRVTGRNALEQNRLILAQEGLGIQDELLLGEGQFRDAIIQSAATEEERAKITALRIPILQESLSAEQRALDRLRAAETAAIQTDLTRPPQQFGATPGDVFREQLIRRAAGIDTTQVSSFVSLARPTDNSVTTNNVAINIDINGAEADTNKLATAVVDKIQRGLNQNRINFNKRGS